MDECFGNNFVKNGILVPFSAFDNSLVYEGDSVYEVLRVVDGNPVFFSDHMERLESSVRSQQRSILATADMLRRDIKLLADAGKIKEVNLKIVFNYNGDNVNYLAYYIKPQYPTQYQYENGVKGILFNAERKDPASKVINHKLRSDIYHKLITESAYEALLVDHRNRITEGSRSNIFFIKGDAIITAPDGVILSGITRKYILEICREQSIKIVYDCVNAEEMSLYEAVFMSGTSPVVLPFCTVDQTSFNVKLPLLGELRRLFLIKAEESIKMFLSFD
jgi:branched-chain amino acid aminotransferase